jgi:hypothetical protein
MVYQFLIYLPLHESTHLAKRTKHKEQWYKPLSKKHYWMTCLRANAFPRQLQFPVNDNKIKSTESDIYIYIFNTMHNYSDTYHNTNWALCQVRVKQSRYRPGVAQRVPRS